MQWTVSKDEMGKKLLPFISSKLQEKFSQRHLKKLIENNLCKVNSRTERFASFLLGAGDLVEFFDEELPCTQKGDILFEDDHLLVYNKPIGINSDSSELLESLKKTDDSFTLVHRLDRFTTGTLIFGKTEPATKQLLELFKNRLIKKSYLALVDGVVKDKEGVISSYLGVKKRYQGQQLFGSVSKAEGLYAETEWKRLSHGKSASLLRCSPITGRTHQIRVHLYEKGHPILGDYHYSRIFRCPIRCSRYLLHAESVQFDHPVTGKPLHINAPLPNDFIKVSQAVL